MSVHLDRRLLLEDPVQVPDGAGGFAHEWQPLGILWATVKAGTGREASGLSRVPYRIVVRTAPYGAPSRPVAGQRLRDGGLVFQITAVAEKGDAFLTCHATEEVAP